MNEDEQLHYLQTILKLVPGNVYWKNKSGLYMGCNNNVANILSLDKPEDIIGKTCHELFDSSVADITESIDNEVMSNDKPLSLEETGLDLYGNEAIYYTQKIPLYDSHGKVNGLIGISIDVTERKLKEKRMLREKVSTESYLKNVVNQTPGYIYWKDTNGIFLGGNKNFAEMAGADSMQELIGLSVLDMPWGENADKITALEQQVMKTTEEIELEEVFIVDGEERIYLTKKSPLYSLDDQVIGTITTSFDVTERKRVEEEKLNSLKVLSATVAHEMRTPLGAIDASTKTLQDCLPSLLKAYESNEALQDLPARKYAMLPRIPEIIETESRAASLFIDTILLNFHHRVNLDEHKQEFSVNECVNNTLERYPFKGEQNVLVHWQQGDDFTLQGDPLLFGHVLVNLLKNALYFIAAADKGSIEIYTESSDTEFVLYFKDTGKGIDANVLPHIFERFYTQNTHHGTGIGLSFCKMVVEAHGGKITCQSQLGEYTLFKLIFPKRGKNHAN